MNTLCVILARAGSKGLPNKNILALGGKPMIAHTIGHARASVRVTRTVVSTDGAMIANVARNLGVDVIERPDELASDTATVDSAARHAVETAEAHFGEAYDAVVILYANVPLRPAGLIDAALEKLAAAGADSVQSVAPVGKMHPYWMKKLGGAAGDVLEHYQPNHVYRRQDLPPTFMLDGGIIAVTRRSLFTQKAGEPHAFLGSDRRAIVTEPGSVVDIDTAADLALTQSLLPSKPADESSNPGVSSPPDPIADVSIAGRKVGPFEPVYVIAELGVNHDGSLDRCLELTRAAKAAGADAVKLQLFDPHLLLSAEAQLAAYQEASATDPFEMLAKLQLSVGDMLRVKALAHELGLGFIVTAFSVELADAMRQLDIDAVKVASPDCVNAPLMEAMLGLGKPLLISTGACTVGDAIWLGPPSHPQVIFHCVSAYPVPLEQANLERIGVLAMMFGRPTGYSDHTTDVHAGMLAVAKGACAVEKHLTYDRRAGGPDHAASFDPKQFALYVKLIRDAEKMLAGDGFEMQPIEADVRRVSRQSVCAVRDLPAGHVVRREDVTVKRPGTGIPAAMLDEVVGRKLIRAVKANHLLHEGDL
jgi:sialic acid synthase SpsE/CMP-N-acetylneuraminic acid synthetase